MTVSVRTILMMIVACIAARSFSSLYFSGANNLNGNGSRLPPILTFFVEFPVGLVFVLCMLDHHPVSPRVGSGLGFTCLRGPSCCRVSSNFFEILFHAPCVVEREKFWNVKQLLCEAKSENVLGVSKETLILDTWIQVVHRRITMDYCGWPDRQVDCHLSLIVRSSFGAIVYDYP